MRNFLTTALVILFLSSQGAYAKALNVLVETTGGITELTPGKTIKLRAMTNEKISDINIEENSIIQGEIKRIVVAKKPKRNGYIKLKQITYTIPSENDKTVQIDNSKYRIKVKNYDPINYGKMATSAGLFIIGRVVSVPGLGQAFALLDGLANPIDGKNRIQSGAIKVYESVVYPIKTAVSFTKEGKQIHLEDNVVLVLSIKESDKENIPEKIKEPKKVKKHKIKEEKIKPGAEETTKTKDLPQGVMVETTEEPQNPEKPVKNKKVKKHKIKKDKSKKLNSDAEENSPPIQNQGLEVEPPAALEG